MRKPETKLDFAAIRAAHRRIRPHIHRTPVLTSSRLNDASNACLFFKCENFQKGGAFKARGATNAVFSLDDTAARRGVATHSSGNHGSAVARAAKLRGIPAHIVMPSNSAKVKVRAVESYGAQIVAIIQQYVNDIVTVSEEAIVRAMRTIWETMKIIVEPSAAVPYAAIIENKIDLVGKRAGIILTGGNVDLDALPWTE